MQHICRKNLFRLKHLHTGSDEEHEELVGDGQQVVVKD